MRSLRFLAFFLALPALCGGASSAANAACELSKYVLQDQNGEEATVANVRECFGWYDRDSEELSSRNNVCFNESAVERRIKKLSSRYKHDVRIVGTRIITISYKGRFHSIVESAVVGSPWLSYEVDPNLRDFKLEQFKESVGVYSLLGGEIQFDFTPEASAGFDTPEALYKSLIGVQFIYKRCRQ